MKYHASTIGFFFIAAPLLVMAGCSSKEINAPSNVTKNLEQSSRMTEDFAENWIKKSPVLDELRTRIGDHYWCMIDSIDSNEAVVAVGIMHPDNFERILTLKVLPDGRIFSFDNSSLTDDPWKLDFAATPGKNAK